MMNQETYVKVHDLRKQGWTIGEIAAETGFHPETISIRLRSVEPPTRRRVPDESLVMNARWKERVTTLIGVHGDLLPAARAPTPRHIVVSCRYRAGRSIVGPDFDPPSTGAWRAASRLVLTLVLCALCLSDGSFTVAAAESTQPMSVTTPILDEAPNSAPATSTSPRRRRIDVLRRTSRRVAVRSVFAARAFARWVVSASNPFAPPSWRGPPILRL